MALRLEKREITLNEKDSILDMLRFEERVLNEYTRLLPCVERKETRQAVVDCIKAVSEEIFTLSDLLNA
jgi:hypothetical protein